MCHERRLIDIVWVHVYLVIPAIDVKFGEEPRITELVE
jgi:hypothetical protein